LALKLRYKQVASIIAFPQGSAVNRPRPAANPFRNGPELIVEPESDEGRDHDRVNLSAAIAVVLLIAAGLWIVNSLVDTQKAQGCYASGTRYCSLL
jgi:hypothetical protein